MAKQELTGLGLVEAKVEAAKLSKESSKIWYILVDSEGDCSVSDKADKSAYAAFKGGSEVKLTAETLTANGEATKKVSKKVKVEETKNAGTDSETEQKEIPAKSSTKTSKTMTTTAKKSAKKVAAKKSAPKKAAKKITATREPRELEVLKFDSIAAAVKHVVKEGLKRAKVSIKGKEYGVRNSSGWAVVRSIVEMGKDGFIMIVADKGYYVYPKADHKELFGKIFASGTYKAIGIYAQSTLPKWHSEYFTEQK